MNASSRTQNSDRTPQGDYADVAPLRLDPDRIRRIAAGEEDGVERPPAITAEQALRVDMLFRR